MYQLTGVKCAGSFTIFSLDMHRGIAQLKSTFINTGKACADAAIFRFGIIGIQAADGCQGADGRLL